MKMPPGVQQIYLLVDFIQSKLASTIMWSCYGSCY